VHLLEDVPLAPFTTLGVGGPARFFVHADSESVLLEALEWAARHGVDACVLGGGSNVVVSDAGFDGLIVRIALRGVRYESQASSVVVHAGAGEPWDPLVAQTVERNLQGLECLSGIPGMVGSTPIQNVGAYGQEVADTIDRVRVLDRKSGAIVEFLRQDCRFSYRDSFFKSVEPDRYVVLEVSYRLLPAAPPTVRYPDLARRLASDGVTNATLSDVRHAVLEVRRSKSMLLDPKDPNTRSCGSFFVNPVLEPEAVTVVERSARAEPPKYPQPDGRVKLSAAWLIERAGFSRGERFGAVGISSRHSLAIVCHDDARADEVVALARRMRARVEQCFGIRLLPEPVFIGFKSLDDRLPDERLA
jgi:UDP-N-acetylmuramate dehydrogenase